MRNCPRNKISMMSAICISLWVVLSTETTTHAFEAYRIPAVVNIIGESDSSNVNEALLRANTILQQAGAHVFLYVVRTNSPKETEKQKIDGGDDSLNEAERKKARQKGEKELKKYAESRGLKIYLVTDCYQGDAPAGGWVLHGKPVICIEPLPDVKQMAKNLAHEIVHALTVNAHYNDPNFLMEKHADGTRLRPEEIEEIERGAMERSDVLLFWWIQRPPLPPLKLSPLPPPDSNDKHGSIFDNFHDQYCEKPDFDPCDPNFGYTDLEEVTIYVDGSEPDDTVIVTIRLRDLFPNDPLLFDWYVRMPVIRGDPNCDPGILLHAWRDANDPYRIRSEGTWENCDPCFSNPVPVEITVNNLCSDGLIPAYHSVRTFIPATLFFDPCNPANEPLVTTRLEVNDPRVGSLIIDETDEFKFGFRYTAPDPNKVTPFSPFPGALDMSPDLDLIWTPGIVATSYDVYLGTDWCDVNDANTFSVGIYRERQDANTYNPGILELSKTYFWRIDEVNGPDIYKGDVWTFMTALHEATYPFPSHGESGVNANITLTWRASPCAASHDVYFGTNFNKVNDANRTNPLGVLVSFEQDANSYDPCELDLGITYNWRVDEVNAGGVVVTGDVWSFIVSPYIVIDDFETYADTAALTAVWPDGGTNGSGAELTLLTSGGHDSPQWMKFWFDNKDWANSHTERNFGGNQDWTASDTTALALHFKGDPNNLSHRVETMTLTLTDHDSSASQDYPGDPCNILLKDWFRWDAALSSFAGIDPKKINKMKISFKDEHNGYGFVYFDDFRLFQSRCIPEYTGLKADITEDCIVNADDLEEIGNDWLKAGLGMVNKTTPDANKLVLQYLFDESSGSNLADNINDYDGTYITEPNGTLGDISDGRSVPGMSGNAFYCTTREDDLETTRYNICIDIPNDVFVDHSIVDDITLSVWMKNHDTAKTPDSGANLLEFRQWDGVASSGGDLILGVTTSRNDQFELVDDGGNSGESQQDWASMTDWTLFIFTKDVDSLRIYNNGVMVTAGDAGDYMKVPGLVHLGTRALEAPGTSAFNDSFEGALDDFRIYSYALSPSDALGLANVDSHYYDIADPPTSSDADLYDDNKIEFKDITVLGDEWLIGPILWP